MEPIPNWYRWLLIVIATLIMCACRSPLQDQGAGKGTLTSPNTALSTNARDWSARPSGLAPAIASRVPARSQLEKIESLLTAPTNAVFPVSARQKTQSSTAVYLRVQDRPDHALQATNAQLEINAGQLESPFTDETVSPQEMSLAPVIDSPVERPLDEQGSTKSGLSADITETEPIVVSQPITLIDGPEPLVEMCPSNSPVAATRDCWLPAATANLKAGDLARRYPDEYICDGGDTLTSVHVRNDWSLRGLDPEDTVGHYDQLDGSIVVEPSNRVCIYAPRFAAVRHVTAAHEDERYLQLQLARRDELAVTDETPQIADQLHQNLAAQRHLALQPPAGFKSRQPGAESRQSQALHSLDKDLSAHENLLVMKYGVHKQSEKARLAEFTAKAVAWSHDKAVQVVLDEVIPQTSVTRQGTDEIFSTGARGPAKFRVIKTASVADALPGEEVEFTLRFDNIGYQPIGNVTIVDNLTTRLDYIPQSQECSLEAEFVNDQNQVDSLTLRWEIRDPIAAGKGGVIRFRCRVR